MLSAKRPSLVASGVRPDCDKQSGMTGKALYIIVG